VEGGVTAQTARCCIDFGNDVTRIAQQTSDVGATFEKAAGVAAVDQAVAVAGLAAAAASGKTGGDAGAKGCETESGGHSNLNFPQIHVPLFRRHVCAPRRGLRC
jgi:hypothetical protein